MTPPPARPWYREPWPWLLMAGPAAAVIAGAVTIWLAVVSNDGLVADDYYKEGLAVSQVLQRGANAAKLGLAAQLAAGGSEQRDLRLLLVSTAGAAADAAAAFPAELDLRIVHPTRAGVDQHLKLTQTAPGLYQGRLTSHLAAGERWLLLLEDSAHTWRLNGDWHPKEQEAARLRAAD